MASLRVNGTARQHVRNTASMLAGRASEDPFEDHENPTVVESDLSGLEDADYVPEMTRKTTSLPQNTGQLFHIDPTTEDGSQSDAAPAARSEVKGRQTFEADQLHAKPARGRISKAQVASFKQFGDDTRQAAQNMADAVGVNLATVINHAGLGAGTSARSPSDFNTYKSIYASQKLADTGCKSTLTYTIYIMLMTLLSETKC